MPYRLILFCDGSVSLAVFVFASGVPALIEEELCLIDVLLVTSDQVKFRQRHFCNLMSRYGNSLSRFVSYFAAYTVGVFDGYIQKVPFSRSLIMGNSAFHHVSQVVEFMAEFFYFFPTFASGPFVRMLGVHGAAGVQIAVRFLGGGNNDQYAVDVLFQRLVGVRLQ